MNIVSKLVLQSIGIILFILIITRLNLSQVFDLLSHANPIYFILANLLFIPLLIVKSIRWQSLMSVLSIKYSIGNSIIIYAASIFLGSITPGNVGDFIKTFYLTGDDHPLSKSFASVFLDRLFDVISIAMLALFGTFFLIRSEKTISLIVFFMVSVLILAAIICIYKSNKFRSAIRAQLLKFIPNKYRANAGKCIISFHDGLTFINANQFVYATVLTILAWIIYFSIMYILALSIHLNISFIYLAIFISISIVITLIPVSISGIGTRDATLIALFSYMGYNSESAVALSMIILAFYMVNTLLCLIAWLINPVDLSQIRKSA